METLKEYAPPRDYAKHWSRDEITVRSYGRNVDLMVWYVAYPAEKQTRDHPGAPAELEIQCIENGGKMYRFSDLEDAEQELIESEIKEKIEFPDY
jgi:hypothetical protein